MVFGASSNAGYETSNAVYVRLLGSGWKPVDDDDLCFSLDGDEGAGHALVVETEATGVADMR
jgi:hypothetical protein